MKKLLTVAITGLFAGITINVAAQSQPGTPTPQATDALKLPQATDTVRALQAADTIKVIGCLKNEKDVAGLKPNVAERAGITEDYILTDVKASPDSRVSGIGLGTMYEIEGIKESDLKDHLNHQIEVTGRLSGVETGAAAATASNRGDVPDFHATSFKMLAATCPMK